MMPAAQKAITRKLQKIAVALKYKYGEDAQPRVVASGKGREADDIIRRARQHEVPLHRDDQLAGVLGQLKVGSAIPEELYDVVAEIIAMVYRMDKKVKPG